jgi:Tol biopolymer transport system component
MRARLFYLLNGLTAVITLALLYSQFADPGLTGVAYSYQNYLQLTAEPLQPPSPPTHFAFVTFAGEGDSSVTLSAYPLLPNALPYPAQSEPLLDQPDSTLCQTDGVHTSPNGHHLIIQYNCHAGVFARLLNVQDANPQPLLLENGDFLDWSPDGSWFLYREGEDKIWLMSVLDLERIRLDLPEGTYNATFTPDGERIVYAANEGLGFGSDLGVLNLADGSRVTWRHFADRIVAYPRWSPDGTQLAYILMEDSNVPYTVGELWLADATGQQLALLDTADAGHGFPPVWSPNGQMIAYVRRENPNSAQANHLPLALHSNIYWAAVPSGATGQMTHFDESLVYDATWSPDGSQLAFTANDSVWLIQPGNAPIQISPPGLARHPVWLSLSNP